MPVDQILSWLLANGGVGVAIGIVVSLSVFKFQQSIMSRFTDMDKRLWRIEMRFRVLFRDADIDDPTEDHWPPSNKG